MIWFDAIFRYESVGSLALSPEFLRASADFEDDGPHQRPLIAGESGLAIFFRGKDALE
jgi:hypothetical protein